MAQSRLERIGTIYTRMQSLMKGGALKPEEKPLWYVVYESFPPKYEPRYNRAAPNIEIRDIFYKEDIIRAKFQKQYGNNLRFTLANNDTESHTQKFISIYQNLEKSGIPDDQIYEKAIENFNAENTSFQIKKQEQSEKQPANELKNQPVDKTQRVKINVSQIFE
ncbi:28S ribosomal protein S23, mitochondrial [Microplitis demolitor]|uniref:28S ribosomal protein S23, mitochondrial n=1 Tax=Microplitis demolitor TaxID=69319 RepID=UPI0004CD5762|nr:28S ribosomal protein S23, mitochondrial [Microplitis demolitor]